jgi:hypothetical protein
MSSERKEPTYLFTDKQVADKSDIARCFLETRARLNANVDKADNFLVKRASTTSITTRTWKVQFRRSTRN